MSHKKKIQAIKKSNGGYDLLIERDAGNEILILTGNEHHSRIFWERLLDTCEEVLADLNSV